MKSEKMEGKRKKKKEGKKEGKKGRKILKYQKIIF